MNHKKKKKNTGEQDEFEFCEVCRLNHNQGRRHIYFPKHKTSLSTLLTRFQSKLSDVKLLLKTPIPLRPEHADKKCIWCIFCNCDIIELDSPFSCGNAIQHLASVEHWKRVKGFMWKHGGGMDRVDIFRIAEVDFAKWEKKCKSLKTEAAEAESVGPVVGPLNRMREIRYLVQYYLRSQRLVHRGIICLGTHKLEKLSARKLQQVAGIIIRLILLLGNAGLMAIPVPDL